MARLASCHPTNIKNKQSNGKHLTVALAGNANVGKSVIFNQLTGSHQTIGNWPGKTVEIAEGCEKMEPIDLEPRLSTKEIPGKCIKCVAEQELGNCLRELLKGEGRNKELEQRFEALVSFLRSPESKKLRTESEKYLAQGKEVKVKIYSVKGKVKYELKVE